MQPGAVPGIYNAMAPSASALVFPKPQSTAKYELDVEKLSSLKPWFAAAVAYWTARLGDSDDARFFVYCRLSKQQASTQKGYAGKWMEWEQEFCAKQDPPLCPLPATRESALRYIGWQARKATVRAGSLRQYMAAVNAAHSDCGFDLPFDGSADQKAAVDGLELLQAEIGPEVEGAERIYLPAAHVEKILDWALDVDVEGIDVTDRAAVTAYRDAVSVVFNFGDFGRGDSQSGMKESDIAVTTADAALLFRLRKQKGKKAKQHQQATFQWPAGVLTDVKTLVLRWIRLRRRLGCSAASLMWKLPWDTRKFDGSFFDQLLQRCLKHHGISAPGNFVFRAHSIREGGASESFALNVQYDKLCFAGGWAIGSDTPRLHYIDFTCPPSLAGRRFFGWLTSMLAAPALPLLS